MFSTLKIKIETLAEKKLRILAYVLIVMSIIDLLIAATFFAIEINGAAYLMIGLSFGFSLIILPLLLSGHHLIARILTPYFACTVLFFFGCYYGPGIDLWATIFIGSIYPFLVFSERERRFQVMALLAPLIFYTSLVLTDYSLLKDVGFEVYWFEPSKYVAYAFNLGTFFIVAAAFFLFSRQTHKYEVLLQTAVEDLKSLRKIDAELNVQMSSLISIICHDIANPLNVAIYNVRRLLAVSPTEKSLLKISQANEVILNIVQSVHRLQELRTGRIKIEDCETKLKQVFKECRDAVGDALATKNMTLNAEIDPWLLENPILADQKVLTYSVILNLLTNAIKFSPHGSAIYLNAKKIQNTVEITVKDSGPGISEEKAPFIFSLTENRSSLGHGGELGSGFGLPIAKTCMTLMLGEISFVSKTADKSPHDHGTIFCLRLRCR